MDLVFLIVVKTLEDYIFYLDDYSLMNSGATAIEFSRRVTFVRYNM